MKRLWIIATTMLLLTACHHNDKPQPTDSIPMATPTSTVTNDSIQPSPKDSSKTITHKTEYTLQQDSADAVNLRLFTRKQRKIFDPSLMVGEWLLGTRHMVYCLDGSGYLWDPGVDLRRDEAQDFKWTMDSNLLTFEHPLTLGGVVMRMYVVTFVDDESLVYRNAYGSSYMWEKVQLTSTPACP